MGFLKRWHVARCARREAEAYLRESGLAKEMPRTRQEELLRLRSVFPQEKMGGWPERVAWLFPEFA